MQGQIAALIQVLIRLTGVQQMDKYANTSFRDSIATLGSMAVKNPSATLFQQRWILQNVPWGALLRKVDFCHISLVRWSPPLPSPPLKQKAAFCHTYPIHLDYMGHCCSSFPTTNGNGWVLQSSLHTFCVQFSYRTHVLCCNLPYFLNTVWRAIGRKQPLKDKSLLGYPAKHSNKLSMQETILMTVTVI